MKNLSILFSGVIVAMCLSSCATQQVRRQPEPIVQKPREVTHVYFAFNKSHLEPAEKDKLSSAVRHLKSHRDWVAQLEGHADAIGSAHYNTNLGDKRARSVKEVMILEGVSPEQLIILSFGEEKPVESNKTDEGRAKNRRVEVKVR